MNMKKELGVREDARTRNLRNATKRSKMLRVQFIQYCILSSFGTLLAYFVGFDRLAIALVPFSTLCVMMLPQAYIDALSAIKKAIKHSNLFWLQVRCYTASQRVVNSGAKLRTEWRKVCLSIC